MNMTSSAIDRAAILSQLEDARKELVATQAGYDNRLQTVNRLRQQQHDDLYYAEIDLDEYKRHLEACVAEYNRLEKLLKDSN